MKASVFLFVLIVHSSAFGGGSECGLKDWPCYEIGMPVPVLFEYSGNLETWDGIIALGGLQNPNKLAVVNGCFLVVSRGLGEFQPRDLQPGEKRGPWLRFEALRGVLVSPVGSGPDFYETMVAFREPFSTLVDLSEHYDLSEPGVYTVYWGVRNLCEAEILFEILPRGAIGKEKEAVQKRYSKR